MKEDWKKADLMETESAEMDTLDQTYEELMTPGLKQALSDEFLSAPTQTSASMDSDAFWAWLEEGRKKLETTQEEGLEMKKPLKELEKAIETEKVLVRELNTEFAEELSAEALPEAAADLELSENKSSHKSYTQKKNPRKRWTLATAAAAACILLAAGTILGSGILQPEETEAGKDPDSSVVDENGFIVIGGDGNQSEMFWTAEVDTFEKIPEEYRKYLIKPEEIPEEYLLNKIKISVGEELICANFIYGEDEIKLKEIYYFNGKVPLTLLYGYTKIEINKKTAYSKDIDGRVKYAVFNEGMLIELSTNNRLPDKYIKKILNMI